MAQSTITYRMARALLRCRGYTLTAVPRAFNPTSKTIKKLQYKNFIELDYSRALGYRWRLTDSGRQASYQIRRVLDSRGRFIIEGL